MAKGKRGRKTQIAHISIDASEMKKLLTTYAKFKSGQSPVIEPVVTVQPSQPSLVVDEPVDKMIDFWDYYLAIAKRDFARHYQSVKGNNPAVWIKCWAKDMEEFLHGCKINTNEFISEWLQNIVK
jgi:hypothetical protein